MVGPRGCVCKLVVEEEERESGRTEVKNPHSHKAAAHETATLLRGAVASGSTTGDFLPARLWHYTTWSRTIEHVCVVCLLRERKRGK